MTTWWWIRHGPTHQKAFTGWRDVPADLSDAAKIARLKAALPKNALIVSSDLKRARCTADAIQEDRTRAKDTPQIREFDFGQWDGLRFDEVAKLDPHLSRAFWEGDADACPPDGESWNQLNNRVCAFVDEFDCHQHTNIIAVAHIGVILTQYARAAAISNFDALAQDIEPLSITRLHHNGSLWSVIDVNQRP